MSFVKRTWKDRVSEYPNRRTINDGYTTKQVTVGRDEGSVTEEGDAFNAANMNDLEDRIYAAVESGGGGGGSGTYDYDDLMNKPTINSVQLAGNKTTADLHISYNDLEDTPTLATVATSGDYNDLINQPIEPPYNVYRYQGVILNSTKGASGILSQGVATITMYKGVARIDFVLRITQADTESGFYKYGINRNLFTSITGKAITPLDGGSAIFYDANGAWAGANGYGGCFVKTDGIFWRPARWTTTGGAYFIGAYPVTSFPLDYKISGTVIGTYT